MTPARVAADLGHGLALPLASLRGPLEGMAGGARPVQARMLHALRDALPADAGDWRTALGLVWRGSLALGASLAALATVWRTVRQVLGSGVTTATPSPVELHPAPPTFPNKAAALARSGAAPVVTSGWLRRPERCLPLAYGTKSKPVALTGAQMTYHALVCGLTGAGKTTLMASLIRSARALGWPVVCLDLKGSPSLRRLFYELDGGRVWTPRGPVAFDLLRGHPDEVAAKIVTVAGTVTGQQFNQIAQGRLTELVKELDDAKEPRTFTALQGLLHREVTAEAKPQQALIDLEARLRTVTSSSAEPWLRPGPEALHLERAVRDGQAVLLSIPVPRLRLVGEKLGAWALAEANRVASRLTATDWGKKTGRRCLLLVDEFAGLKEQGTHVSQPLAMVREGGVSIWLFTQTLSGLKRLGDVAYSEILGNMNVQIVLRQSEPGDQAAWSELLGTYRTQEFTRSLDGKTGEPTGNFRAKTVEAPYVTPGQIAALPIGQGYLRIAGGRPLAVVFPNTAGAQGEEPDVEAEDDDGTPTLTTDGDPHHLHARTVTPPIQAGQEPSQERPHRNTTEAATKATPDLISLVD